MQATLSIACSARCRASASARRGLSRRRTCRRAMWLPVAASSASASAAPLSSNCPCSLPGRRLFNDTLDLFLTCIFLWELRCVGMLELSRHDFAQARFAIRFPHPPPPAHAPRRRFSSALRSACHDTTLRRLTRRPSLPTSDATQRTFVRR
jgi:hypothetical protein